MNKLFIMAAAVGVALTACTSEKEDGLKVEGQSPITFANPVVSANTRTVPGEIGTKYAENQKFSVFAVWTAGDFASWGASTNKKFMEDVEVSYVPGLGTNKPGAFAPATDYFWPKDGKLTFAAYSPSSVTATYGAAGLVATDFAVPANGYTKAQAQAGTDAEAQYDFMYAPRVKNQTNSTATGNANYNGVNLVFKHALSSVQFTAKASAAYDGTIIKVQEIAISGVNSVGTFKETITDGAEYSAAPVWSDVKTPAEYKALTASDVQLTAEAKNTLDMEGQAFILMPQQFTTTDAKLTIKWTMQSTGGEAIAQVSTFDLKDIKFNSEETAEWKMGYRYIYNIIIGLDKIYFAPQCEAWKDGGNSNIEIK